MNAPTTLVFPHVEAGSWSTAETEIQRELARIMMATSRIYMPDVPCVQLTNDDTPAIEGASEVWRRPSNGLHWIPWLCDFLSRIEGQVLYMDTDVVIQRDLRRLFLVPCDAMFTWRGPKVFDGRQMPFLFGLVAYRTSDFWVEVRDRVLKMTDDCDLKWWGSQVAVFEMWMEERNGREKWQIASVECDPYSYTPKSPMDAPRDKWALHYKGKRRKRWMRENWKHLIEEKVAA